MHDHAFDGASRLRVLVVDADERVRGSLAGLLSIGSRIIVVGAAGDPGRALEIAEAARPDVVVLDPRLPEIDRGRTLIDQLRRLAPGVSIVVLCRTEAVEDGYLTCEADGYVRKTFRPNELVDAIVSTRSQKAH